MRCRPALRRLILLITTLVLSASFFTFSVAAKSQDPMADKIVKYTLKSADEYNSVGEVNRHARTLIWDMEDEISEQQRHIDGLKSLLLTTSIVNMGLVVGILAGIVGIFSLIAR